MKRLFSLLSLSIILVSCTSGPIQPLRYHATGIAKPVVAVLPIIDITDYQLDWDLSDELTVGICQRMIDRGALYLAPEESMKIALKRFEGVDLIDTDENFIRDFAASNEFLVLMELIEHKEVPYNRQRIKPIYPSDGEIENVLMMKLRIKVFDLRNGVPQIILQEIVHSNHMMPKAPVYYDYNKINWGNEIYSTTPIGRAHARLERDVAVQVEKYISVAKS